jgi:hypothetical protein
MHTRQVGGKGAAIPVGQVCAFNRPPPSIVPTLELGPALLLFGATGRGRPEAHGPGRSHMGCDWGRPLPKGKPDAPR